MRFLICLLIISAAFAEDKAEDKNIKKRYLSHLGTGGLDGLDGGWATGWAGDEHKTITKTIVHTIPKLVHVPYAVDRPVPVKVPVEVPKPYPVTVPVPQPYPVVHTKTVHVPVDRPVPVKVPVHVPAPYPVKVPVHHTVPVPVVVREKVPILVKGHEDLHLDGLHGYSAWK